MAKRRNDAKRLDGEAVIYARYSSHNQRDASIEQQIAECRQHAAEMGLVVTATYEDRAVSGKTDKRPSFQRMMRDAEKGKFRYVLAWKSNRIGRNMLQAMVNEAKLNEWGVKVYYAEEDFDDTAAGRFALRSMMNVNQFYSENMAEDITRGMMDNASKCLSNGSLPLGYKRGEDGRVELDEPAAAIVREVYSRVATYEPFADIAADLNARGIRTKTGARWNKGSFTLCKNERYRGIYIFRDVRVEGGIPRIVSDDLWYRVQEVLQVKKNPQNGRHRTGAEDYLLTGKIRCGHCGSYMSGISGTSKSGTLHHYYTCQKRRTEHACDKKNVRRDVIELAVAQAIRQYVLTDEMIEWIATSTEAYYKSKDRDLGIMVMEEQLQENKKATSNMLKAIEAGIITDSTRKRLLELENEQSQLSARIEAAKAQSFSITKSDMVAALQRFRCGDVKDKKWQETLFDTFLLEVYVYDDDHLKIVFSFVGDKNTVEIPFDSTGKGNTDDQPHGSGSGEKFVLALDSPTKTRQINFDLAGFFCLLAQILP